MSKLIGTIREAIEKTGLKDGMTISFHHHMRNGDYVLNMVLEEAAAMGIRDLTVNASSIFDIHEPILEHIKNGVVTQIECNYMGGKVGKAISQGIMEKPVIFRTHGGRAGDMEKGSSKIDVAFLAAPCADDMGNIERRDNFRPDTVLPDAYQVDTDDYTNSGFARGHLCPNADRDGNKERQDETFFMTNIAPQNSSFNSGDWKSLESYCQKQASSGSELFIVAGVYGKGGIDKDGNNVSTYTNPKKDGAKELSIPSHFWKVVVILDAGDGDLARIDEDTVAFAVDFDNAPVPDDLGWEDYAISIDTLESRTGLDFLSALPDDIESALESKIQAGI